MYESLNFRDWPFKVVPDPEFAKNWAGRNRTLEQIGRMLWKAQFAPKAALHLLWADFGMGKTHSLLHIKHLASQTNGKLIPIYTVMPKRLKGFIEVYRAIVSEFPYDYLGDQLVVIGNTFSGSLVNHPMFSKSPGVVNAILAMRSGDSEKQVVAKQWLFAQPGLISKEMRMINVTYRVKTPEDAINSLNTLTKMLTFSTIRSKKLLLLFDEYQRIGELNPTIRQEINAGMHGYFDDNPEGLEILMSFSFGNKDNLTYLLSKELLSRSEPQSFILDVFTSTEAVDFLRDLLSQFRLQNQENWSYPFSITSVNEVIKYISDKGSITPRKLMLVFNHVMMEAIYEIGPNINDLISESLVTKILSSFNDSFLTDEA